MPAKRRSKKRRYTPAQETDLAQAALDGMKDFMPGDSEPKIDPERKGFDLELNKAYIDGWRSMRNDYEQEQRRLDKPPEVDTRPATQSQQGYLNLLIGEHGIIWEQAQDRLRAAGHPSPPDAQTGLTVPQASVLIEWLAELPRRQCEAQTKSGQQCRNTALLMQAHCSTHSQAVHG